MRKRMALAVIAMLSGSAAYAQSGGTKTLPD
jgi:hypothetical protein